MANGWGEAPFGYDEEKYRNRPGAAPSDEAEEAMFNEAPAEPILPTVNYSGNLGEGWGSSESPAGQPGGVEDPGYTLPDPPPPSSPQAPAEPQGSGNQWGDTTDSRLTGTEGWSTSQVGDETYLEPYIRGLIEENRGLGQAELAGAGWSAATGQLSGTPQPGELGYFDAANISNYGSYGGASIDPIATQGPAQAGYFGVGGQDIQGAQQAQARAGQYDAMKAMSALAQGLPSQALNLQREQATRERNAMMAAARGAPAAAILRQGAKMAEGQEREIAQAAAQQQLAAQQGLSQVAGSMRQQDIGLATQQAELYQQASMMSSQQRQQVEMQNAQLRQQAGMARMDAFNQRAMQQAQLQQQAGLAEADRDTQVAMQNAAFVQQAEEANFQASQQRDMKMAEFQQQANMSNAEMEQARQIAEAQVNAQLEQTRGQLINSLVAQGVDRYKAELQADTEVQMQYNDLLYKYFAVRQGAVVELGKEIMNSGWFWEDSTEVLQGKLENFRLLTGMAAPYGGGGSYDIAAGVGTYPWSYGSQAWGGWNTPEPPAGAEAQPSGSYVWDPYSKRMVRVPDEAAG